MPMRHKRARAKSGPSAGERVREKVAGKLKRDPVEDLRAEIAPRAHGDGTVVVGPFTGEVGFELLYWIPFIRWVVREFPGLRGRLIVVSRGGSRYWWSSVLDFDFEYVDILSLFEPPEYVARKGADKQRRGVSEFDEEIIGRVIESHALPPQTQLLHPSVFFDFYYRARKGSPNAFVQALHREDGHVEGLAAIYSPLPAPDRSGPVAEVLPDEYVAVRFYSRESFPGTPENRRFAAEVIDGLSRRLPVVLLDNQLTLDEHGDFEESRRDNVVTLDHLMTPVNNLQLQTVALAHARAYVGTYGGLSYLAPFLGVSSLGFSSLLAGAHVWHLALAQRLFDGEGWGSLVTLRPKDMPLLELVGGSLPLNTILADASAASSS
jgi:hypothetical protein